MKAKILEHLSRKTEAISGERLSEILGVSRVAVWKHIRQLQALGYEIEATTRGYRLVHSPDTPFQWAFGERSRQIHYFTEVTSTMDMAMDMARKGSPGFTFIVAETQTKGRGRLQRQWQSNPGGLYFTLILRPSIEPILSPLINLAAAVDLASVLQDLYGIEARLKWPNDLLVQGRKVAGILSQMVADNDRIEFINLGIGINVHNETSMVAPPAISVAELAPAKTISRVHLLQSFWDRFEQRSQNGNWAGVVPQWKQRATTLGRHVKVHTLDKIYEGIAVDVEPGGGLVLITPEGRRQTIVYGDCFHQDASS